MSSMYCRTRRAYPLHPAWFVMLVLGACGRADAPVDGMRATSLARLDLALPEPQAPAAAPSEKADATRPGIRFSPDVLRVYRATPVDFEAEAPSGFDGETWRGAICRWTFGDGSPAREGCAIAHTFTRGTSDERVTLEVRVGNDTWTTTQIVPLERLPVGSGAGLPAAGPDGLPASPKAGTSSFRMALVASTGFADNDWDRVMAGIRLLAPGIVVHLGEAVPTGAEGLDAWEALREGFAEPLRRDGIPVVWALSPADLTGEAMVRRPAAGLVGDDLELVPGSRFPDMYALAFKGTFIAVLTGAEQSQADMDWIRARLTEAQVYESRIVLTHLPLHPFSRRSSDVLGPKFKLYELFLRTRVSLVASAGHGVHFDGRYGALPVMSVGRIAGPPETLAGHDFSQPPTIAVMDIEDGQLVRTFALEYDGGAWRLFDSGYLPETVEVYTR